MDASLADLTRVILRPSQLRVDSTPKPATIKVAHYPKLAQLPYPGDVRVVRETNNGG